MQIPREGREKEEKESICKCEKHVLFTTYQAYSRGSKQTRNSGWYILIIEEQNAHFLPRSLMRFSSIARPRRRIFYSLFREERLRRAGRRPRHENAMHSPRTRRRPTVLDTITLKCRPGCVEPNAYGFTHVLLPVRQRAFAPF